MDLERLKIDRSRPRKAVRRGRAGRWIARLVVLALLGGAIYVFREPITSWVDRFRLPEVDVAQAQMRRPVEAAAIAGAAANGYIVARTRAALSADTPGRIVELNVTEGQFVEKGFVVARLYADEYSASLRRTEADLEVGRAALERSRSDLTMRGAELKRLQAGLKVTESNLEEARAGEVLAARSHERTRELVESGTESPQLLDERRAQLDGARARVASAESARAAAEAEVAEGATRRDLAQAAVQEAVARIASLEAARDLARATLEKTEVRAPFDGVVVLKDAEVGEVVSPNSTAGSNARGSVVTMVDFDSLEVQAEVPEASLASVKLNAPARIFLDAFPDRPYRGRVDRIWPTANRQKATVEVRVVIEDPDRRLRPEMGVRVVFESEAAPFAETDASERQEVVLIPTDAVVRSSGRTFVFVVERDVALARAVELGGSRADRVVVAAGLEGGESVIRLPPTRLEDGDRVQVRKP